jgi:hypothetical protein
LAQHTKNGGRKYQMTTKYTKCTIFHFKAFQNIPKLVFFGMKMYHHLATLFQVRIAGHAGPLRADGCRAQPESVPRQKLHFARSAHAELLGRRKELRPALGKGC